MLIMFNQQLCMISDDKQLLISVLDWFLQRKSKDATMQITFGYPPRRAIINCVITPFTCCIFIPAFSTHSKKMLPSKLAKFCSQTHPRNYQQYSKFAQPPQLILKKIAITTIVVFTIISLVSVNVDFNCAQSAEFSFAY